MKRRSILPWSIGLVVVAAAAVWFFAFRGKAEAVTYRTEPLDRGEITVSISATGTLEAVTTVQVGSQVSGTIAKLYADFNDKVTEGQLLAQLDPTFLQASVSEQQANVDRARAQMNEAQRNFDRTTGLFERQMVAQVDLDAATTSLETAKASLRQSEAALQRAQVNLRYATIKAPISGVVISRDVDVGQTVAASLSAPTLYTIANDLTKMRVEASVDEADIGTVAIGMPVTFRVDAYPEDVFTGVLSQVRLQPVVSQNVVTYVVIIDVENKDAKLMPGMTATVTIETARRENALRAPLQAIRFTPANLPKDMENGKMSGRPSGSGQPMAAGQPTADSSNKVASSRPERTDSATTGERMEGRRFRPDSAGGDRPRRGERRQRPQRAGAMASVPDRTMSTPALSEENPFPQQPKLQRVTLWVLDQTGQPRPINALRGIQSTRYVELITDELKEGDQVIVGTNGNGSSNQVVTGSNPFMPRMPGGGGQRSGGQRSGGGR